MSPRLVSALVRVADRIDHVVAAIGRTAAWAVLAVVLLEVVVALLRYGVGFGSIALQESAVYAHATLIMLAAAWTLARGGHVRVDLFYAGAAPRRKALVDAVGTLVFLVPFCLVLLWLSLPYVARSWAILERSREARGLPLLFLLKSLVPLFALLLLVQGASQLIRAVLVLAGHPAAAES